MTLYLMHIDEAEKIPEEICRKLIPLRKERSSLFLRKEDALRSVAAGFLIATVTGAREADICYNEWGKPYVEGQYFNVSHSGDYAVLVCDDKCVGVDIEKSRDIPPGVAERVFVSEEILWMNDNPKERFWELWTLKESVMKLDGRGLSLPPESFSVLPLINGGTIQCRHGEVYGRTTFFDGHVISVSRLSTIADMNTKLISLENAFN